MIEINPDQIRAMPTGVNRPMTSWLADRGVFLAYVKTLTFDEDEERTVVTVYERRDDHADGPGDEEVLTLPGFPPVSLALIKKLTN